LANAELAHRTLKAAESVVCFTSYVTDELLEVADVLLPISTFAETAGTYINVEGIWQSFDAAAKSFGDSKEGWRVLRVLGNALDLPDCEYSAATDVCEAFSEKLGIHAADTRYEGRFEPTLESTDLDAAVLDIPIYSVDAVVRRGRALQDTAAARETAVSDSQTRANA
jgi:NADH-quinone oxidoreductase subunit G